MQTVSTAPSVQRASRDIERGDGTKTTTNTGKRDGGMVILAGGCGGCEGGGRGG